MKYLLIMTVVFTVAAFGAMSDSYLIGEVGSGNYFTTNAEGGVWDQLVTSDSEWASTAYAYSGTYGYWIADDFEADDDYDYDGFGQHGIPLGGSAPGDTDFELYDTDLTGAPTESFTVSAGDITQTNTGWTFAGYSVYLYDYIFPDTYSLANGSKTWTAFTMTTGGGMFAIMNETGPNVPAWDPAEQYNSGWGSVGVDASMRLDGDVGVGVESASLGEVKAVFK
jgi:hypothetical protein